MWLFFHVITWVNLKGSAGIASVYVGTKSPSTEGDDTRVMLQYYNINMMVLQFTVLSTVCSSACPREHQRPQSSELRSFCDGNPPVIEVFPSPKSHSAESVSLLWRKRELARYPNPFYYSRVSLSRGPILHDTAYFTVGQNINQSLNTQTTPILRLDGRAMGVLCEDLGENWSCYNDTAQYMPSGHTTQ